jgi:iron complex transport system substrate-binding protein
MRFTIKALLPWFLVIVVLLGGCTVPAATPAGAPASGAGARTITHALGESTIPATPQRIVALEWTYVENLLALGIQPVGVADIEGFNDWVKLPVALDPSVVDVGDRGEPNLEALAQLQPDLIIAPLFRVADTYEELNAIAPTIVFDPYPTDENVTQFEEMRQTFLAIADLVGRAGEGEAVLARLNQKFAAARSQLEAANRAGEQFVLAQAFGGDAVQVRLFTDNAMATEIVSQLGLENGWEGAFDQYGFTTVSIETLPELGDVNFFYVVQDDNNVFARDAILPLWESLPFVQQGNAYALGGDTWLFGGPLSAELLIDKVVDLLAPGTAAAAFPVTIEHKYGSTTIDAAPARIVTVGLTDHDALLALDIVPVGTSEWFGDYPGSVWPWAQHKLGDQLPEAVGGDAINFEKIAALQPDLILALFSGVTQEEYDLLAQIAPTVAQPAGYVDYGIPWQELTVTVGKAVGKQAEAETLVADVEAKFAQVRAAHPEFEGATSVVATPYQGIWVYGPQDVRGRFLTLLGFTLPEGLAEITGADFGGNLSMERADLLDVDVIVWLDPEDAEGELGGPVYQSLPVHTEGREVFLDSYDDPVGGATSFVSVLSLPFLLDELVPQLAAAMEGSQ